MIKTKMVAEMILDIGNTGLIPVQKLGSIDDPRLATYSYLLTLQPEYSYVVDLIVEGVLTEADAEIMFKEMEEDGHNLVVARKAQARCGARSPQIRLLRPSHFYPLNSDNWP